MPEFAVSTPQRVGVVDITKLVSQALGSGDSGSCLVFAKHTTCGILCCPPAEVKKTLDVLEAAAPSSAQYQHGVIDSNAHAHLKALLLGCGKILPVSGGRLVLPAGSLLYLAEFDGPQSRNVEVKVF